MKRMMALLIAGVMVFSMAACGQGGKTENTTVEAGPRTEDDGEAEEAGEVGEVSEEAEGAEAEAGEAAEEAEAGEATEEAGEVSEDGQAAEAGEAGEAELTDEQLGDVQLDGGWTMADSPEITEEIKEMVDKGLEELVGAQYVPVAYIGSQVVAGLNHAVLCTVAPVVPDAVAKYAVVIFYEDLEGNVTMTDVFKSEAEAEVLPDAGAMVGGWSAPETPAVTEEAEAALEKAVEGLVGAEYEPVALLATQLVSGMNYSLLCRVTAVTPEAGAKYAVVHVYQDLEGNAEITDIYEFDTAE